MKKCSKCEQTLEKKLFPKDKKRKDGLHLFCKKCVNFYNTNLRYKLKVLTFESYGGCKCVCCGETHISFLSLDHINGKGNEHRLRLKNRGGPKFYAYLKQNSFPDKEQYQVLCMNCQFGKELNKGICPHKI